MIVSNILKKHFHEVKCKLSDEYVMEMESLGCKFAAEDVDKLLYEQGRITLFRAGLERGMSASRIMSILLTILEEMSSIAFQLIVNGENCEEIMMSDFESCVTCAGHCGNKMDCVNSSGMLSKRCSSYMAVKNVKNMHALSPSGRRINIDYDGYFLRLAVGRSQLITKILNVDYKQFIRKAMRLSFRARQASDTSRFKLVIDGYPPNKGERYFDYIERAEREKMEAARAEVQSLESLSQEELTSKVVTLMRNGGVNGDNDDLVEMAMDITGTDTVAEALAQLVIS